MELPLNLCKKSVTHICEYNFKLPICSLMDVFLHQYPHLYTKS